MQSKLFKNEHFRSASTEHWALRQTCLCSHSHPFLRLGECGEDVYFHGYDWALSTDQLSSCNGPWSHLIIPKMVEMNQVNVSVSKHKISLQLLHSYTKVNKCNTFSPWLLLTSTSTTPEFLVYSWPWVTVFIVPVSTWVSSVFSGFLPVTKNLLIGELVELNCPWSAWIGVHTALKWIHIPSSV